MNRKNDLSLAKSLWRTALISAVATLSSCSASNEEDKPIGFETITELPAVITNLSTFDQQVNISGNLTKQITFDVSISENYASLSLLADDVLLVDNIDIPTVGEHTLKMIVKFPHAGLTYLRFVGRTSNITLTNVKIADLATDIQQVTFKDISQDIGLVTEDTLKYGGPSIGDINNNGHYDFVLNNHNSVPTQLVTNNGDSSVTVERLFSYALDFHGSALGDYDNDGDLDIMVALGGANGTSPTSYALLNNNDGSFKDVSVAAGITTPARGRSPRWADFDRDGDLDILLGNAKTTDSYIYCCTFNSYSPCGMINMFICSSLYSSPKFTTKSKSVAIGRSKGSFVTSQLTFTVPEISKFNSNKVDFFSKIKSTLRLHELKSSYSKYSKNLLSILKSK